ncbi:MAG: hypothetical protein A4S08_04530 [Proteobacteria bacterium SG_bin4]|nr:MAG: hypothetical protein A4S08_04530 [Proteobacteria bacterium SG_bin4]
MNTDSHINFSGFSPNSFEQFIRALSIKVIGPGVSIFGNGPDGGREAIFQGEVNYPYPPTNVWNGYGVIQAKFKEKTEGTQKDQGWAKKQLSDELIKWGESSKRNPKPDYFIYCTNVDLSSTSGGGKDAMEKILEKHKPLLGLKAFAIWDANQLKGYIDGYEEIRKRFTHFLTPGDLLSAFMDSLPKSKSPDAILTTYLCREIQADEDARLSQAGDRSEDRIKLANVFMDLPVSKSRHAELTEENLQDEQFPVSLHELLSSSSHKLDPLSLFERKDNEKERLYGRLLFLGGPGSGKSTIGQFFSQIHRAALLDRYPQHRLESKIKEIIKEIKSRCEKDQIFWPRTPRYPFRIELNAFAKALAANSMDRVISLSEYLRQKLSRDSSLTHEDLRELLRTIPLLLILDGLDEVPSSSNRREVISAIQDFLNESRNIEADLMIVASSRPDGYAGEFDGDEVAHRYLVPLSKSRALNFAQRYVSAKVGSKGDQRTEEAMSSLRSAIENPLVAKLMRSPLQVTFMVTVVAASGKPSESRWQLFNDYYRTIYERELHKAVPPFDKTLNERRQDIDALHHRVGFILQCRAESSGGTQADMSLGEFEQLVSDCLNENGLLAEELEKQKEMILGAANQRLVFLTTRTPGRLSFDVRSLQEYMAAACITNADSEITLQRLETIAHSAYWRNTLLFAVGRFFVEPQMRDYRDKIRLLCEDLNRKDSNRSAVKLGSHLALAILESGTTGNNPLFMRSLTTCALELLANPPGTGDILERLTNIYQESLAIEYEQKLPLWLRQIELSLTLSAWILILYLEKKDIPWAKELIAHEWPDSIEKSMVIFQAYLSTKKHDEEGQKYLDQFDTERMEKLVSRISITKFNKLTLDHSMFTDDESSWLKSLSHWIDNEVTLPINLLSGKKPSDLTIYINPIITKNWSNNLEQIKTISLEKNLHPDWKVIDSLADFYTTPCATTLANVLEFMANHLKPKSWATWARILPWPLGICLNSTTSAVELLDLASKYRDGKLGDFDSWISKQKQWRESGIELDELCSENSAPTLALAINQYSTSLAGSEAATLVTKDLFKHLIKSNQPALKEKLAWILENYVKHKETLYCLDPLLLQSELLPHRDRWWSHAFMIAQKKMINQDDWVAFYDHFGRLNQLQLAKSFWNLSGLPFNFVLHQFSANTSRLGLLRLLGFWCASGYKVESKIQRLTPLEALRDVRFRLAAILVLMTQHDLSSNEIQQMVNHVSAVTTGNNEPQALHLIISTLEYNINEKPELEPILTELIKNIPPKDWQIRARAENLRIQLLETYSSGFDKQKLLELRLPALL